MNSRLRFITCVSSTVLFVLGLTRGASGNPQAAVPDGSLVYHPEGDAIVIKNGTRWDNRPMYCFERMAIVTGGEMPGLAGKMGVLRVAIKRGEMRLPLHHFAERIMRYRPGRVEWEMTDPRLPGLKATLVGTTLAEFSHVMVRLSSPVAKWEQIAFANRDDLSSATPFGGDVLTGAGLVATADLTDRPQSVAVACDENEGSYLTTLKKPLDPSAVDDAAGVALKDISLETLSQEVVIGLMGVSIMNPTH